MASRPELIAFSSREAMAARVSDLVELQIAHGFSADNHGEVAVSGGSTPQALYENLASRELSWNDIHLTLVDERWVDQDHPRSNEAFVRRAFAAAHDVSITGLYNGAPSLRDGVAHISTLLGARKKPFDVVIVGMGDDGHSASWFPHAEGLENALLSDDWICAITANKSNVTGEEVERVTLTLTAIRDARLIVLLLAGDSKRAAFDKALEAGPVEDMPVRAILRARPDMWVCWAP